MRIFKVIVFNWNLTVPKKNEITYAKKNSMTIYFSIYMGSLIVLFLTHRSKKKIKIKKDKA